MLAYCTLTSKPYLCLAESFHWFVSYRCGFFRSTGGDYYIIKLSNSR